MLFLEYPSFQGKKAAKAFLFMLRETYFFSNFIKKSSNKKEAKVIDMFLAYIDLAN